jgi:3-oxoacyl-(acyl-carrier-protein) synthase
MLFPRQSKSKSVRRVVVTGAGILTALGSGWARNAIGFKTGEQAFRKVTLFDTSRQRVSKAAEVDVPLPPENRLTPREKSRLDRATAMLLSATHEAWQQAGWAAAENMPFILGTTSGGMREGENYYRHALATPRGPGAWFSRANQHPGQCLRFWVQCDWARFFARAQGTS